MIAVITVDETGRHARLENIADESVTVGSERIYMRPDVPPINTPLFDIWLRDWHAKHNPTLTGTFITPETVHDRT